MVAAGLLAAGSEAFVTHKLVKSPDTVAVPDSGTATPYPSTLEVSGLDGLVESIEVFVDLTHGNPDDLDILLVGPTGKSVLLMSDAGGTTDLNETTVDFRDGAAALPDTGAITEGPFRPTNYGSGDVFP